MATRLENSNTSSWCSESQWSIASGSLENSITFESSGSPIDDDGSEATVTSTPKSPLFLSPPTSDSDSGPCEITIRFMQKHEIRQVYVRSTARVFEIYSVPTPQSSNEYLCTVRCGIAIRDGEVLQAPAIEEVASTYHKGSNERFGEENAKSEDDWVEVKVPATQTSEEKSVTLSAKTVINSEKSTEDFYEASAEVTDANSCTSITLRLLSLQSKSSVCIDEIYVYADPAVQTESEDWETKEESSSGSSLISMFLPTLLQLSKSTGVTRKNDENFSDRKENHVVSDIKLEGTSLRDFAMRSQQEGKHSVTNHVEEEKPQEVNGGSIPIQIQMPSQFATIESKQSDPFYTNVQKTLEQLLSRMDHIEDLCLGFQEKMLQPLNIIETRLQCVEQQLEMLCQKVQNFGLPTGSRFFAPDASYIDSDSNSSDNGTDHPISAACNSDKEDVHMVVPSAPPSVSTSQPHPGLRVRVPAFSNGGNEEVQELGPSMNSSNSKEGQAVSIDDALASALAGFITSVSMQPPKCTKTVIIRAPDFSNDDDDDDDDNESINVSTAQHDIDANHSIIETGCTNISNSLNIPLEIDGKSICHFNKRSSEENERKTTSSPDESFSEETINNANRSDLDGTRGNCMDVSNSVEHEEKVTSNLDERYARENERKETSSADERFNEGTVHDGNKHALGSSGGNLDHVNVGTVVRTGHGGDITDLNQVKDENINEAISCETSEGILANRTNVPRKLLQNQRDDQTNTCAGGETADSDLAVAIEETKEAPQEDILRNVLGFSCASTAVDYEIPLLDVKFVSDKNFNSHPSLEALLIDMRETEVLTPQSAKESHGNLPIANGCNLVSVEDGESSSPAIDICLSEDLESCQFIDVALNIEGENPRVPDMQHTPESSLI